MRTAINTKPSKKVDEKQVENTDKSPSSYNSKPKRIDDREMTKTHRHDRS